MPPIPPVSSPTLPSLQKWLGAIALAAIWLSLWASLAPHVPAAPLIAYAFAFLSVGAMALLVGSVAPVGRVALALAVPAAAGLFALHRVGVHGAPAAVFVQTCLLTLGTAVGAAVGSRIEHPGHLLFVVPISALADIVSVQHPQGVSAVIIADEATLSVLALPFAMLDTHAIDPLLGVGDVVFIAMYVAVARMHQLSRFRTLAGLAAGLIATGVAVVVSGEAVPALPALGAAMLVVHPKARHPRSEDRRAGLAGLGLVALAAAWLLFLRG